MSCFATLLALAWSCSAPAASDGYLRGYGQALLDREFAALGLQARAAGDGKTLDLVGDGCVDAATRAKLNQALTGSGPIQMLRFALNCDPAVAATAPAAVAEEKGDGLVLLPAVEIFQPLRADPREPQFALGLARVEASGRDFNAGLVSAGETFMLVEGHNAGLTWQFGIQGGVFSIFEIKERGSDLRNTDFRVAAPLTLRHGNTAYRIRIYHESGHVGDEFLVNNPGFNRLNVSYEAIDAIISQRFGRWRLYGGGGRLIRSDIGREKLRGQFGVEWYDGGIWDALDVELAADFKLAEATDWTISQSYQAAIGLTRGIREISLLLQYFHGTAPHGQFFRNRYESFAIGLRFDI